jgi:hypothetical protein
MCIVAYRRRCLPQPSALLVSSPRLLPPQTKFFIGMRDLDDNPDTVLDDAVLGSTPQSVQILGVLEVYKENWITEATPNKPPGYLIHMLPQVVVC